MSETSIKLKKYLDRRRFIGLMDLYDRNFTLINLLIPDLLVLPEKNVIQLVGLPDLYLDIQERCKFTTMLKLTYWFSVCSEDEENTANKGEGEVELIADPDLNIRVYHDARAVEAMSCKTSGFMSIKKKEMGEKKHLDCRWDSNMFLNKWLEYMVGSGYEFSLSKVTSMPVSPKH